MYFSPLYTLKLCSILRLLCWKSPVQSQVPQRVLHWSSQTTKARRSACHQPLYPQTSFWLCLNVPISKRRIVKELILWGWTEYCASAWVFQVVPGTLMSVLGDWVLWWKKSTVEERWEHSPGVKRLLIFPGCYRVRLGFQPMLQSCVALNQSILFGLLDHR